MRSRRAPCFLLVLAAVLLAAPAAFSAQMVSTTTRGLNAVMQAGGFMIQSVGTAPASYNDLAPQQLLEIVRPNNQPFTIGRMFTSCTCVRLEADSRSYGPGERAVLRLRNVVATPPSGQNYAVYVQITSPINTTLRFDTFMQSSQFVPAAEGFQPTRGNVISDGYIIGSVPAPTPAEGGAAPVVATVGAIYSGADIEVIVPKADNYIPDTSEYTLRKKAEAESAAVKADSSQDKDTAKGGVPSEPARPTEKASEAKEEDLASTKQPSDDQEIEKKEPGKQAEVDQQAEAATAKANAEENEKPAAADSGSTAVADEKERQAIEELRALARQADKGQPEKAANDAETADAQADSLWKEVGKKAGAAGRDAEEALESADDAATEEASSLLEGVKEAAISAADEVAETAREAEKAGKDAADVLKDEVR